MNHNETIQQLGGFNKLRAMIGAKNFIKDTNYIQFRFSGYKKANIARVELTENDDYKLSFLKFSPSKFTCDLISETCGIYCDNLQAIFEDKTGLCLSL